MSILQNMTALKLLQLKAFKFQLNNPFKWANGWLAPLYCDDRKVLSYPKMRDFIRLELARTIAELYPDADVIAGVAMNAIAHGVLVAEQLSLPFVYVHPTPKDHGLENQVNAGNNCVKIVEALRNNGCKILGIVTIFDFEFPSTQRKLNKLGVDLTALTNLDTILHHAVIMGMINKEEEKAIKEWQNKPSKWNK